MAEQIQIQNQVKENLELLKTVFAAVDIDIKEVFRGIRIENCKIKSLLLNPTSSILIIKKSRVEIKVEQYTNLRKLVIGIGKKRIELENFQIVYEEGDLVIRY